MPTLPPLVKGDEGMDIDLEEEEGCGHGGTLCFSVAQRNNNKSQYRSQKKEFLISNVINYVSFWNYLCNVRCWVLPFS